MDNRPRVSIIDYGMGNLFSVRQACERVGLDAIVTSDAAEVLRSERAILPGVGAFGDAMKNLRSLGLVQAIKNFVKSGRPFMGICLGMQLLMSESEEFGHHEGLGIIRGTVRMLKPIDSSRKAKVPQIGWKRIRAGHGGHSSWMGTPLENIRNGEFMYFVHSYFVLPEEERTILSLTDYEDLLYPSSIKKDNIFACQFHPEKSALSGLEIYRSWAGIR
ncbi:MAG: imidazole glycerol phosphate synthase subunit HisH [Candidatus Omnitrophica bacterium]|nr:imidazole glycerol phosphate synthase subunit HisH [Candidatus Omnitrophota bacterium]